MNDYFFIFMNMKIIVIGDSLLLNFDVLGFYDCFILICDDGKY